MKRLAFLLTGDMEEAEDLLQSAYARVFPKWKAVRDYDNPDAYMRRLMVNQRISWWRRRVHRAETATDDISRYADHQITTDHPATADAFQAVIDSDALLTALRELAPRQRTAVVLRHYCDLTTAEVAELMGCSVGTVKSQTARGLSHLRQVLASDEGKREHVS